MNSESNNVSQDDGSLSARFKGLSGAKQSGHLKHHLISSGQEYAEQNYQIVQDLNGDKKKHRQEPRSFTSTEEHSPAGPMNPILIVDRPD